MEVSFKVGRKQNMIFVTVGTHEQQFDRLVRCVDRLKAEGKITEEVMIQTGFPPMNQRHAGGVSYVLIRK